jgi:hypothetical protein
METPCFLFGFEAEPLVEERAQSLIALGEGSAQPKHAFGFHCEAPERFVERVDIKAALGELERVGFVNSVFLPNDGV